MLFKERCQKSVVSMYKRATFPCLCPGSREYRWDVDGIFVLDGEVCRLYLYSQLRAATMVRVAASFPKSEGDPFSPSTLQGFPSQGFCLQGL